MITEKVLKQLEYDKILEITSKYVSSKSAKQKIFALKPAESYNEALKLLEETIEAYKITFKYNVSLSFSFDDVKESLDRIAHYGDLVESELLRIARLLKTGRIIRNNLLTINAEDLISLKRIANDIFTDDELESDIFSSIISENEISDNASLTLSNIRKAIKSINASIRSKLNSFISGPHNKYLQDNIITLRMNRYVLPVKSEYRSQIIGIVHDQSATGATLYIEPMAVVELNNDLKKLLLEEGAEIKRILKAFSDRVRPHVSFLEQSYEIVSYLDCVFSKARFADEYNCIEPTINNEGYINIERGRHPLIDKNKVVPIDIKLGKNFKVLIISGPNTGGKTVTLKLCGLFALMAMSGFYLPCADCDISFFKGIYSDIGDAQSIEENLSTFSSHLTNIIDITDNLSENSLALFDELGGGTDPIEGSAIAIGVIEYLLNKDARCITTSHYNELKEYAYIKEGVENASMDFDPDTFAPTYKLLIGISGVSNAIQIASRLGLNKSIVNTAYSKLSDEKIKFNKILFSAEKSRRKAEEYKNKLEIKNKEIDVKLIEIDQLKNNLISQNARLNEQIRKGAKDILSDYEDEAEEIINNMKELLKKEDEAALFEARKEAKKLQNINIKLEPEREVVSKIPGQINIGDTIFIKSLKAVGEIIRNNEKKKEYTVKVGVLNANVKYSDVYKVKLVSEKKNISVSKLLPFTNVGCSVELKLLGKRAEEALSETEKYLELATRNNLSEVRIVHGKGTGALRKVLHEYFKTSPYVASFRLANYGEGDAGVTIVTLKK